jgi:hypothetical protein
MNPEIALEKKDERIRQLEMGLLKAEGVLQLIAVKKRPDGTYNRDREACGQLARQLVSEIHELLNVYDLD